MDLTVRGDRRPFCNHVPCWKKFKVSKRCAWADTRWQYSPVSLFRSPFIAPYDTSTISTLQYLCSLPYASEILLSFSGSHWLSFFANLYLFFLFLTWLQVSLIKSRMFIKIKLYNLRLITNNYSSQIFDFLSIKATLLIYFL